MCVSKLNPPFQLVKMIHRVEEAMRCGLDSTVEESDDETAPNGYQATIMSEQVANVAQLHPLTHRHIHQYFITGRLCHRNKAV